MGLLGASLLLGTHLVLEMGLGCWMPAIALQSALTNHSGHVRSSKVHPQCSRSWFIIHQYQGTDQVSERRRKQA